MTTNKFKTTLPWQKIFSKIFKYALPYKFFWILIILSSFSLIAISLFDPLILKYLIDNVLATQKYNLIIYVVVIFAAVRLLSLLVSYLYGICSIMLSQMVFSAIRNDLFNHIQYKQIGYYSKKEIGDLIRTLTTDAIEVQKLLSVIETVLENLIRLTAIIIIIFYFNWELSLIALGIIPIYAFVQALYFKQIRKEAAAAIEADVNLYNFFEERLSNIFLIKLFTKEKHETSTGKKLGEEYARKNVSYVKRLLLTGMHIGIISSVALILSIWIGASAVAQGLLTIGGLIAIYTYIAKLFGPISILISIPSSIQGSLVSGKRIIDVITEPEEQASTKIEKDVTYLRGKIYFDHVSFAYPGKNMPKVLQDLTFEIAPGEKVAIVGGSGSGKSTIIKLLLRFFEPQKGEIDIDDKPIASISRKSLRQLIGVVAQEELFLPDTVRENIAYANPSASFRAIKETAVAAGIDAKISSLDQGYDTIISSKGAPFSAGELQRISIARTLLKKPDVFIFDEPTAELDSISEKIITNTIKKISSDKTAIIVAHHISALSLADRILVLKNGKIVEQGTLNELLKTKGEFHKLYNISKRTVC